MGRRTLLLLAALLVAALGSTLVFAYARTADARAREGLELQTVLVAADDIPQGTTGAGAQDNALFVQKSINREAVVPGALSSATPIRDQVALAPIFEGEQILQRHFGAPTESASGLPVPEGRLAMTITLSDPARVVNFVRPGSHVTIFVTMENAEVDDENPFFTRVLLAEVDVLAIGEQTTISQTTTSSSGEQTTQQVPSALMTFAVTQEEAQKIIFAQGGGGTLYLGLVTGESGVSEQEPATNYGNLFD